MFDFAGTGSSTANDATPGAYQVKVPAALPIPSLTVGFPIRFEGFVTPFGSAPPDFAAITVVDFSSADAFLLLAWASPGVTAPFAAPLSDTHMVIAQSTLQGAQVHVIRIGPQIVDPASVSAGLSFVPSPTAQPLTFAIAHADSRTIDSFTSFADFVTALTTDLNGTTAVRAVAAEGRYDQSSGVLTVTRMIVALSGSG